MRARWWATLAVAAAAATWGGAGYLMTSPVDFHDYRTTAVGAAQSAYNAVATARLAGRAQLAGRLLGPYVTSTLDDSRDALSGAVKRLSADGPPDERSAALRDELDPLLSAADAGLGELERATHAGDDDAQRGALDTLDPVSDRLSAFIEEHK
jgi:hypothetical protein